MSGKAVFASRARRLAAAGIASLGACAVLAACSPVQVGSAAIVGNQRITVSTLDTQVANLQTAIKPYSSSMLTTAEMPRAVLSWLIRFAVMNQVAASNGISVTAAQSQAALNSLASAATSNGYTGTAELLIENGVSPQMFQQVGEWEAVQDLYALKVNGGKEPTTTAQQDAFTTAINKAQCTAAGSLNISVSPQYGRFDYATSSFSVVAGANTLSAPGGAQKAASTAGLTSAAC